MAIAGDGSSYQQLARCRSSIPLGVGVCRPRLWLARLAKKGSWLVATGVALSGLGCGLVATVLELELELEL